MTTLEQALAVRCPPKRGGCGARPEEPCVFMLPPVPEYLRGYWEERRFDRLPEKFARVGKPTARPHRFRFAEAERLVRLERFQRQIAPLPAAVAYGRFAMAEHEQLRAWLRINARILVRP